MYPQLIQKSSSLCGWATALLVFFLPSLLVLPPLPVNAKAHHGANEDDVKLVPDFGIEPPLPDGYFESNPEEGNSPWGEKVAACNIRTGCRIDDGDPDVGPPPNAPALPAGSCNPVPPTAPAPSDAEAASALPARLGVNPHERGLTGLETWFWVNDASDHLSWTQTGSPGVDANCNQLPAATATFTAAVESWTFHLTGDHESATYASERPGTEDNPAANHTFEYVDFYQLELTAQLRGDVSGEVLLDQREYEVVEVRPHLTE